MPDISTPKFIDFEIIVQHEDAVRLQLLQEVFGSVARAAIAANLGDAERIAGEISQFPLPRGAAADFYQFARAQIETDADRLVWLESVEAGSSKFKGRIVRIGGVLVVIFLENLAGDVLGKQKWYQDLVDAIDRGGRHVAERIVDDLNRGFPNHHGPRIEAEIVGDRVRIIVHPQKRDGDMVFSPNPPRRY